MTTRERTYTLADLRALEAAGSEKTDYELIAGGLYPVPTPSPLHNAIVSLIHGLIFVFLQSNPIGRVFGDRTGYTLDDGNEYIPDVSYVSYERVRDLPERFTLAPDLAVEVVSPSNTAGELHTKMLNYFKYGTRLMWVIYPETQTVVVSTPAASTTLTVEDVLDGGDVLPGFRLNVRDIFDH